MGEHYFFGSLSLITRNSLQERQHCLLKADAISTPFLGYPDFFCYQEESIPSGKVLSASFTFENYEILVTIVPGSKEFWFEIRTIDFFIFLI